ncbi:hypothetical protein HHK36_018235 [Tetracentron sinense]|uniref:FAS1 domain-containing protein n=1 Tax=Tetracentron sinense TaxID=13715 RepID=A0A834Z123_TETSI|nr:hypothetical protein HHK36_018220 [Tetracentron sinense]KAF8396611.1 hypothetical protein HHK36_018235 [Tetracentron sinense]
MMMKQLLLSFSALLVFLHFTTTLAQAPAKSPAQAPAAQAPALTQAQSPASSGPANVTAILEKAGKFSTLILLLKNTQVGDQINSQISNTYKGLTLFAPTDAAFSNLKSSTLNSLSDKQTLQLIQFHVLPTCISLSQFQAVSNPLHTVAGDSEQFPLNVTASSSNQVSISTGLVNATVTDNLYTDSQLAVYEVDKVLLPLKVFGPKTPAPAPIAPPTPKQAPPTTITPVVTSTAMGLIRHAALSFGVAAIAAFSL